MTTLRLSSIARVIRPQFAVALLCLPVMESARGQDADLDAARAEFLKGGYEKVIERAAKESDGGPEWRRLRGAALMAVGKYEEARDFLEKSVEHHPLDLQLKFALYDAQKRTGHAEEAKALLEELDRLGGTREWAYREPDDRVALARIALIIGADPKRVLEVFLDPLRKENPDYPGTYLATGDVALEKSDYALAAKTFGTATRKFPEHPEAWFGLARAFEPSDTAECVKALQKVIELNPRHVGAHLLLAETHINGERYAEADVALASALTTNPNSPEAHALKAVLAHLRADAAGERAARVAALKSWKTNPAVPHLIGKKLSQKYRFAEGAAAQREALEFDPKFIRAKAQLASDLLRLGEDEEGWKLAEEVQTADPYDVVAYNLVTLRDVITKFRILESEHFLVRMDPKEADVYGERVVSLLERAHSTLTGKYGLALKQKTIVEIFPDQKDFAIRTFGLPGGAGYLGVCFGRLITANSPAARPGSTANWEAILWHEFCHVVTLTMTNNKMPRWLSEGISVYEERKQRANWGEQMKPRYRAMILGEDFTPVSQLSAAFLRPKSPIHLGFAYYESSLVVEWLIERWGLEKMKALLADLAKGKEMNLALAANYLPIEKLDDEFADHARRLANNVGPQIDWTNPPPRQLASSQSAQKILAESPNNYDAILSYADKLLEAKQWREAKMPLERLIELYPEQRDPDGAYAMLAKAQRELGEVDAEIATLTKLTELTPEATSAFTRLCEIYAERKEWPKVVDYAQRFQAVDPLKPEVHRVQAEAHEAMADRAGAISAYQTMLHLKPADPAEVHFRLARLLHAGGKQDAKRHVLLALEEAPRFRAAHQLLLEIAGGEQK